MIVPSGSSKKHTFADDTLQTGSPLRIVEPGEPFGKRLWKAGVAALCRAAQRVFPVAYVRAAIYIL